jgi:hypothetical protein
MEGNVPDAPKGRGKIAGYIGAVLLGGAIAIGSVYYLNRPHVYTLDLNNDGIQDLAVSDFSGIPVLERDFFYIGQKDGSFRALSEIDGIEKLALEASQRNRLKKFGEKLEGIK